MEGGGRGSWEGCNGYLAFYYRILSAVAGTGTRGFRHACCVESAVHSTSEKFVLVLRMRQQVFVYFMAFSECRVFRRVPGVVQLR